MLRRNVLPCVAMLLAALLAACDLSQPAARGSAAASLRPSTASAAAPEPSAASASRGPGGTEQASASAAASEGSGVGEQGSGSTGQASTSASPAEGRPPTPEPSAEAEATASAGATIDLEAAARYCTEQGGRVVTRQAVWGTGQPPNQQVRLAGVRQFCNFESAEVEDEQTGFRSQIEIALDTLYSEEPTLAMLAYLTPRPLPSIPPGINPSSVYCSWLGGTSLFGGANNIAGGGWLKLADDTSAFEENAMCVFSDLSAIEEWGLTYNANGIVRGVDLATVARYAPDEAPSVFPDGQPRPAAADASPAASGDAGERNARATVAIDQTSKGTELTLSQGQTLVVALPANPSTGFTWQVEQVDDTVLRQAGDPNFRPTTSAPGLIGAPRIETLPFHAVGAGETTLTLVYRRPFEQDVTPTPENIFSVTVTVER